MDNQKLKIKCPNGKGQNNDIQRKHYTEKLKIEQSYDELMCYCKDRAKL